MHASLDMGGSRWERTQYALGANGEPREYRATNAALMKHETQAMGELAKLALDSSTWEVIPFSHRTVLFRNQQFRLISTFGCGISAKHISIHSNFPFAAFPWLLSSVPLSERFGAIECKDRLGVFLKAWVAYWESNGGLE